MVFDESCAYYRRARCTPTAAERKLLFHYFWAGHYICRPDFHIVREMRYSYLILCTLNGEGELSYAGNTFPLTKGSVFFIDCRNRHEYYSVTEDWEFCYLHIDGSMVQELYSQFAQTTVCVRNAPATVSETVFSILELKRENPFFGYTVSESIYHILCTLLACAAGLPEQTHIPSDIRRALKIASERPVGTIGVEELAEALHMSRVNFSCKFKKYVGVPPKEYLLNQQVEAAKKLLEEEKLPVEEISIRCGFSSSSAFARSFRTVTGFSPVAYRNACRGF